MNFMSRMAPKSVHRTISDAFGDAGEEKRD